MPHVTMSVRKSDIRRIRISCRCGTVSIAEVPQQVARAMNLHPCPGCFAAFIVSQQMDGKWNVKRVMEDVADMTIMDDPTEERTEKTYTIGSRIRIVDATKFEKTIGGSRPPTNPHPEHIGKTGTIVAELDCGNGYSTPQIKLDDGTVLTGAECWWEPVMM